MDVGLVGIWLVSLGFGVSFTLRKRYTIEFVENLLAVTSFTWAVLYTEQYSI